MFIFFQIKKVFHDTLINFFLKRCETYLLIHRPSYNGCNVGVENGMDTDTVTVLSTAISVQTDKRRKRRVSDLWKIVETPGKGFCTANK